MRAGESMGANWHLRAEMGEEKAAGCRAAPAMDGKGRATCGCGKEMESIGEFGREMATVRREVRRIGELEPVWVRNGVIGATLSVLWQRRGVPGAC